MLVAVMIRKLIQETVNGNGGNAEAPYVWGAEGAIKTCDHLLFDDDKTENAKGTVIGNGDTGVYFLRVHRLCPKELT